LPPPRSASSPLPDNRVWAPLLLVMSRLIQGISAGGEAGTASSLILEYAPAGYRGRFASVQIMTMTAALLTDSALEALLSATMPLSAADQWGWRLPFLLAAPLGAVTLYARSRVAETPRFQVVINDTDQAVRGAMARTPRRICFTVAVQAVGIVGVYTFLVFMPLYLETLGLLSRPEALLAGAVATGMSLAAAWPFGALRPVRTACRVAGWGLGTPDLCIPPLPTPGQREAALDTAGTGGGRSGQRLSRGTGCGDVSGTVPDQVSRDGSRAFVQHHGLTLRRYDSARGGGTHRSDRNPNDVGCVPGSGGLALHWGYDRTEIDS
jgi:MFS family permease